MSPGQSGPVTSAGGERIEYVGETENPGRERDVLPEQSVGIPAAVPVLVMMAHHGSDVPGELDLSKQVHPGLRMSLHRDPFLGGKGAGSVQD